MSGLSTVDSLGESVRLSSGRPLTSSSDNRGRLENRGLPGRSQGVSVCRKCVVPPRVFQSDGRLQGAGLLGRPQGVRSSVSD